MKFPVTEIHKTRRGWAAFISVISLFLFGSLHGGEAPAESSARFLKEIVGALDPDTAPSVLRSSPDGKRVAQVVVQNDRSYVVVNDQKSKPYDAIVTDSLQFSPDSKRVGYGAILKDRNVVVVDGVEYPAFDASAAGMPIFSPDSKHFAYIAKRGEKYCVVLDGKADPDFDLINPVGFGFSPDGSRFAYAAKEGEFARIVVDGTPCPKFRDVTRPTFSPDGKHFAYVARSLTTMSLMLDGSEVDRAPAYLAESLTFEAPDTLHVIMIDGSKIVRVRLDIGLKPAKP